MTAPAATAGCPTAIETLLAGLDAPGAPLGIVVREQRTRSWQLLHTGATALPAMKCGPTDSERGSWALQPRRGSPPRYAASQGSDLAAAWRAGQQVAEAACPPAGQSLAGAEQDLLPADSHKDEPSSTSLAALRAALSRVRVPSGMEIVLTGHQWTERTRGFSVRDGYANDLSDVGSGGGWAVDVLAAGRQCADEDVAWRGPWRDETAAWVVPKVEEALCWATRQRVPLRPETVQLHLAPGSTALFLHEVCGHLLEHQARRGSPLSGREGSPVAPPWLTVEDDPRLAVGRFDGYGSHAMTALGTPATPRVLIRGGVLERLLDDAPDGPWRSGSLRRTPAPRMSNTVVLADAHRPPPTLDTALGEATALLIHVERIGFGYLDHTTGAFTLEVKRAWAEGNRRREPLEPFLVTGDALATLADLRSVGPPGSAAMWSAYCLTASGRVAVGGHGPALLTGPLRTLPHTEAPEVIASGAGPG
ncbi:metallopeptidase TldD-related protein [Streptomyces sp. NPDC006386]|uniref:metallopeptidase TldD-related protein n=1 Tax=Streptomyces sp. NPDC006386 TaxID=3156762 RepID=UPI0033B7DE3D